MNSGREGDDGQNGRGRLGSRVDPTTSNTKPDPAVLDRAKGALLGLAVGDALGTTLEFTQRDAQRHHGEMRGGGPFDLGAGDWTDDTAMALALGCSLVEHQGFDPQDLMTRFVSWWRSGAYSCTGTCFDIGTQTRLALDRFERNGDPFAGSTNDMEAGNGSLMRISPVALFALHDDDLADRIAEDQSRTTHGARQAVDACVAFVRILRHAISGQLDPVGAVAKNTEPDSLHPAIAAVLSGSYRQKPREAISSSGYVVHTLEAALWCVHNTRNFEDAVVLAVNLGDDADTVGAVTGQLAGALYGASAIPERWLMPLAWRDDIKQLAGALHHLSMER
ncbi:ADP-ribosylglycohydrolase family protein [Aureimonas psammosilenae]|uniref:ADP-ribosylglycohydrolase family protein n=1 Tax=Aureimonas psammosilenae TaxID=2495496 RepID=UPI001260452F|nr:ADP-ribosylglycohydrolase family protein [Aureimonas psammosilenae]